jgi:hypothetical protein
MSLKEMEDLSNQWARQLTAQKVLRPEELEPLLRMPKAADVAHMSLISAIARMIWLDILHYFELQRLKRRVHRRIQVMALHTAGQNSGGESLRQVVFTLRRQLALTKRIVFYSKIHRIFNLWHVIHRPFPYSFAVLALIHVTVVLLLGYF